MANHLEVFDDYLNKLKLAVEENRLSNCNAISSDLTKYSVMTDYQDGVLIAEIFESVFSQIRDLFTTMEVSENERERILAELKNHIVSIKNTYKDNDKNLIYQELKKIRNAATRFQIHCWNTFSAKPQPFRRIIK